MVPKVPGAGFLTSRLACPLNAGLDELYAAYPVIIRGPDFWTYFHGRQDLISPDGVHLTARGTRPTGQHWADTMARRVYRVE